MRVPGIAWMPGRIQPGVTSQLACALDLFPTALALAGAPLPEGAMLDGVNLTPLLMEQRLLPERPFFFYRGDQIFACRLGDWKAHFKTQTGYGQPKPEKHETPLLFHLGLDPSEKRNVASNHAPVLARIQAAVEMHRAELRPGVSQLK